MKTKTRKLKVNGKTLVWSTGRNNCDGDGGNRLTICENKKQVYSGLIAGNIQITPSLVKATYEKLANINC
jgi:hypothetical protein